MEGSTAFPSASSAHHRMLDSLTNGRQIASRLMEVDVSPLLFYSHQFLKKPSIIYNAMLRAQHSMRKLSKSLVEECGLASH